MGSVTVFFVRHAEPGGAPPGDPGLSETGRVLAELLARMLSSADIGSVLTSTAARTVQTAAPTAAAAGVTPEQIPTVDATVRGLRQLSRSALVVGHSNTVGPIVFE